MKSEIYEAFDKLEDRLSRFIKSWMETHRYNQILEEQIKQVNQTNLYLKKGIEQNQNDLKKEKQLKDVVVDRIQRLIEILDVDALERQPITPQTPEAASFPTDPMSKAVNQSNSMSHFSQDPLFHRRIDEPPITQPVNDLPQRNDQEPDMFSELWETDNKP